MTQSQTLSPSQQPDPQNSNQQPAPVTVVKEPLKILKVWQSPARPYKKRDREFYTTAGAIIFLVCVILLFIKEFLLILVLIALAFFIYVLNNVQPETIEHQITTREIITDGKKYPWDSLGRFWFATQWGDDILYIEHFGGIPPRLMILLGDQDSVEMKEILDKYIIHEKPSRTKIERAGQWLQEKIPLESFTEPPKSPQK